MTKSVEVALALMRMALALLDKEGESLAVARLQQAIDSVGRWADALRPPREGEDGAVAVFRRTSATMTSCAHRISPATIAADRKGGFDQALTLGGRVLRGRAETVRKR